MKQYLLSVCLTDDGTPPPSPEEMQPTYQAVAAFNERLQESGAWVFAGGLYPASTATVVRISDGAALTTDGPYAETKEQLGGFWIVKAADLDAALALAERGARACRLPVEVRPFQEDPEA